jgi:thiol-disulfide isomerase/thioredoxin
MNGAARKLTVKNLSLLAMLILAAACGGRETSPSTSADSRPLLAKKAKKPDPRTIAGPDVGNLMPRYTAQWLDGKLFDLAAERDHVVFLNLWATWCGPCRAEMPYLQSLQEQYGARGLKVIGVSLDEGGVAGVNAFLTAQKIHYPSAIDPEGRIANLLQTTVLPTSVLIDRTGHIVWKDAGMLTGPEAALTKALEQALAK